MQSMTSSSNGIGVNCGIQIPIPSDLVVQSVIHYSEASTSSDSQEKCGAEKCPKLSDSTDDKLAAEVIRLNDYQLNQKRKRWVNLSIESETLLENEATQERQKKIYKPRKAKDKDPSDLNLFLPKILDKQNQLMEQQDKRLMQQEERLRLQENRMESTDSMQHRQSLELINLGHLIQGQSQKLEHSTKAHQTFFINMNKNIESQMKILQKVVEIQTELVNTTATHTEQINENSKELWSIRQFVQTTLNEQNQWNSGIEEVINGQSAEIVSIHKDLSSLQQCLVDFITEDANANDDQCNSQEDVTVVKDDSSYNQSAEVDTADTTPEDVVDLPSREIDGRKECPYCKGRYAKSYINSHITSHCRVRKYC